MSHCGDHGLGDRVDVFRPGLRSPRRAMTEGRLFPASRQPWNSREKSSSRAQGCVSRSFLLFSNNCVILVPVYQGLA